MESGVGEYKYTANVSLFKNSLVIDIASSIAGVITALILLNLVKRITEAQENRLYAGTFD